ncbi:MAG: SUF system Fe-S cluster assembly regulator [Legionellales bacterium RIFCSPHIGHO2_12_FULL_42_9]|nr:MAG: SUF system Fe-S cluster assembly regulator [Legionellales bacterium RIFCSPHIGHO2_12_FULL_42_9]
MLRISKLADYGTVIMVYLAKLEARFSNAGDIASHTHLAKPTVSKLLKRLTAAGLLVSVRGVSGGYRLQRLASEISIADIIYAVEGNPGLVECSVLPSPCSLQSVCSIQGNWRLISQAIETALDSVSLEALARPMFRNGMEIKKIHQVANSLNSGE